MLTNYDYLVITFYFVFMAGMGWFFRNFSKNASDFFRGGGQMTWWLVGASAFMASFSAWTFTGAASIAYEFGIVILVIYLANAIGFFLNFTTFAPWFRQMRVITVMQAIRQRFGPGSEQFFTWLQLPIQIFYAAIWLFGLAVFAASVFGMNLPVTIVVTGLVVLLIATMGGSWAVVAGDFLQALILMPITVVVAVLALVAVGGVGPFFEQIPPDHLDLLGSRYAEYGLLWVIAMVIKQIIILNNMQDAARYLCVKDGGAARKAAMLSAILFLVGPVIWFIPPMAARILYPDLVQNTEISIQSIYRRFDLPLSAQAKRQIQSDARLAVDYKSSHLYTMAEYGLSPEWLRRELGGLMKRHRFSSSIPSRQSPRRPKKPKRPTRDQSFQ